MKKLRMLTLLFGLAVLFAAYFPLAHADEWDKTTKITFSEPVQVPGRVLPAGTYIFKLFDSQSNRHIVQIFNEDHSQLITTIMAIPNQRLEPAGKTILKYDERPADQPMALAAWFYPGDNMGQEFVYPKAEAEQLSRLNKREVPSLESREEKNETAAAQTANPPAEAKQETPPAPSPAPSAAPKAENTQVATRHELPHTASLLPLIGFIGISLLGVAALLRMTLRV
jgi:hypothetical protein